MRAVAIDDDAQMHNLLRDALTIIDTEVDLVAFASSKEEGLTKITDYKPDVLFLDIELPDGTGFELLEEIDFAKYLIIFISGFGSHGRRALEFEALDYLDKPLLLDNLEKALQRAQRRFGQRNYLERMEDVREALLNLRKDRLPRRLTVSNSDGFHFLPLMDIVCFAGETDLVTIITVDGRKIRKATRLSRYVKQFKPYGNFKKVNRHYLVNLAHVISITTGPVLRLANGLEIPISHGMSKDIREDLDKLASGLE